jgi:EmrB/QacA subfamily drug resistance transporter
MSLPRTPAGALPPLTREQILITAGVMAGIAVAALDSTVVGTAMPTIIGQLGGLEQYGWVFSGYLLTATTTVPLYSKLADIYGRKPIFLFGLALFVAGSMLCGLSTSMPMLIAFRTLQGLGAGAVQPIAFTIVGDTFDVARRARMQGVFSAVWGFSAIVGPALGGIITQTVGWRWVFFVNLPVGLVAAALVGLALHEHIEHHRHAIDWAGAATLTGGVALLLFAVSEGGPSFGWTSPTFLVLLGLAIACLLGFLLIEPRAPEPLVDFGLLRVPAIAVGLAVGTLAGVVMYGLTAYVPPMVQGVHGGSPIDAGAAVAAMSIGWPIGSVVGGRTMLRVGVRPTVILGTVLLVVGSALLTQLAAVPALWFAMLATGVTGLGMGFAATTILVVVQSSVDWRQRGMATGLVQFSRTIGGAVGVGLMGAVLTASVGASASAILDPIQLPSIPPAELAAMRDALAAGLSVIYYAILGCAVLALALALRAMPAISLLAAAAPPDGAPREPRLRPDAEPAASGSGAAGSMPDLRTTGLGSMAPAGATEAAATTARASDPLD